MVYITTMVNILPTEQGHYYYKNGHPAYTVIGKNGKERNTTLADCKKLGLLPSVTEILKLYPRPYLGVWQKKQVLMSALTLTRLPEESDEALIARIMADADEQARIAREKGTDIHGAIERFICRQEISVDDAVNYVRPTITALEAHLGIENILPKCETEKSFAHWIGYGGKIDLHSRELNFVCDFKTKEFSADDDKQLAWDEQIIQLEAYRRGLDMPTARMINVYVSTSVLGLVRVIEHKDDENERYWKMFLTCMKLWMLTKQYEPVNQKEDTNEK